MKTWDIMKKSKFEVDEIVVVAKGNCKDQLCTITSIKNDIIYVKFSNEYGDTGNAEEDWFRKLTKLEKALK